MTENQQPHRPGTWPTEPVDLDALDQALAERQAEQDHGDHYARYWGDHAWTQLVLDNIRLDLERHPSPTTIRTAERRWKNAITQLADELINTRRNER